MTERDPLETIELALRIKRDVKVVDLPSNMKDRINRFADIYIQEALPKEKEE